MKPSAYDFIAIGMCAVLLCTAFFQYREIVSLRQEIREHLTACFRNATGSVGNPTGNSMGNWALPLEELEALSWDDMRRCPLSRLPLITWPE